ncbi:MFS transporter [Kribbella sp. NPDC056345]|uniref:MFS transporter n=1 Tax=Kribbella sp. NPDC056345 TaxID=3345789 RepID=UPI0035D85452
MEKTHQHDGVSYRTLIWLAVAAFSTGIDGYVLAGLLPAIADDLRVSEAAAGQLMTVFALTSAIAAPILGTATSRWERRRTIALSLAVFVVGNLIVAVAPNYGAAISGRVVAALGGCLLNAAILAYVIAQTPIRHRGKALSFVLGGWMTATALGVPVGLVIGQSNWRFPMVLVAIVGTIALAGIMLRLPELHLPAGTLADRLRPLRQPRLLAGLLVTVGILCSSYTCFTYATLIFGPTFRADWMIILIMFGYGLFSMLGNFVTGRLTDRFTPIRVLTVVLAGLLLNSIIGDVALAFAPFTLAAVMGLVWFFLAGVGNGGAAVPQQARLGVLAGDSAAIVMALNGSAISLGAALGGGLGGITLATGAAPHTLLTVAAVVLALTLALHLIIARKDSRLTALG